MEGKAQQLKFLQQYRIQQVSLDVENAYSARGAEPKERIAASQEALTSGARTPKRGKDAF